MPDNVTRSGRRDLYDHLIKVGVIQHWIFSIQLELEIRDCSS